MSGLGDTLVRVQARADEMLRYHDRQQERRDIIALITTIKLLRAGIERANKRLESDDDAYLIMDDLDGLLAETEIEDGPA